MKRRHSLFAGVRFIGGFVPGVLLMAGTLFAAPGDWPQWRGPDRTGIGVGGPLLARAWPGGLVKLWESEVIQAGWEAGWSTPSVADGKVYLYVPQQIGGQWRDVFICLNASNGQTLWKKDYPGTTPQQSNYEGCSTTVCVDGGRVYGAGSNGADSGPMLYCLNAGDGSEISPPCCRPFWPSTQKQFSAMRPAQLGGDGPSGVAVRVRPAASVSSRNWSKGNRAAIGRGRCRAGGRRGRRRFGGKSGRNG